MKIRYILPATLAFIFTIILCLTGCRNASHNGKLDAQWQVMTVENTDDGSITHPHKIYMCLTSHVVNLYPGDYAGNFSYDEEKGIFTLDFPYREKPTDSRLYQWGIYDNPVTFTILKLDGKQLVIRSGHSVVTCRRF